MSPRAAVALATALLFALVPSTSRAAEVSAAEFEELLDAAPENEQALERLRAVDSVDGRPVDLGPVLDAESTEELQRRLEALETDPAASEPDPDPRDSAAEILADKRYADRDPPRPLKGALEWIGDKLLGPVEAIERFVTSVMPGGPVMFWILIAIFAAFVAAYVSSRMADRGLRARREEASGSRVVEEPGRLERAADEAERAGDLETSLRLRFRAGVLRLAQRGAVPRRSSLTSEEISASLASPTFERVAATFDRVVYGRRPVTAADVEEARQGWRTILKEARA